jgi:hypothetical protein
MIAAGMIVTALAAKGGISHFVISLDRVWFPWTSLFQKYPPGPMYLLMMGGTALLLVGGIIIGSKSPWMRLVDQIMEPVGKNSLPVFVAQFFVYFSGMYFIFTYGPSISSTEAGGLLLCSLVALWVLASWCERHRVSRVLTTGVVRLKTGRASKNLSDPLQAGSEKLSGACLDQTFRGTEILVLRP